jgi:uncharacterized protein (TIGR02118 family)
MITRSAVLEGTVPEPARAAFDHHMQTTVLQAIARYPGLQQVRLRRPAETEADAPRVYMVFDLEFDSLADMHTALASPTRQEVRSVLAQAMSGFEGRVYHLVLDDVATLPGPSQGR